MPGGVRVRVRTRVCVVVVVEGEALLKRIWTAFIGMRASTHT